MVEAKTLSVIIPANNEQDSIKGTVKAIIEEVNALALVLVIVIVDDGSVDNTWEQILTLVSQHPDLITGLKLSRNYGKDRAILAGLESISSSLYLVIDADGEHPIDKIGEFYTRYQEGPCDVVHGIKRNRRGSPSLKFLSRSFNRLFKYFANIDLTGSSDFKLFNQKFKIALLNYGDHDFFFRAAAEDIGHISKTLAFDEKQRVHGVSSWGNKRLVKYAFDLIVNYSYLPLFLVLFLGVLSVGLGLMIGVKALIDTATGNVPEGYMTLLILALVSLGMIMTAIGIIGVYLAKIFDEVKGRPRYIIEEKVEEKVEEKAEDSVENLAGRL